MARTAPVEESIANAIASAIAGIATQKPEEVYRYPRANFGGLPHPCAMVVVDNSDGGQSRADNDRRWRVRVWVLLIAQPENIADMKAWVLNALEADETLGGVCDANLVIEPWDFGFPVGSSEGAYAWAETTITAFEVVERGKNIESP